MMVVALKVFYQPICGRLYYVVVAGVWLIYSEK